MNDTWNDIDSGHNQVNTPDLRCVVERETDAFKSNSLVDIEQTDTNEYNMNNIFAPRQTFRSNIGRASKHFENYSIDNDGDYEMHEETNIEDSINTTINESDIKSAEFEVTDLDKIFSELMQFCEKNESAHISLAKEYEQLCAKRVAKLREEEKKLQYLSQETQFRVSSEISLLQAECNTWKLLHILFSDTLKKHQSTNHASKFQNSELWRASHKQIIQDLFNSTPTIRRQQLIIEWLESITTCSTENLEIKSGIHTIKTLQENKDPNQLKTMVTEVDPDARVRQRKLFHKYDEVSDQKVIEKIWSFIRCGKLKEAQEWCRKCGQYWRAATLDAGTLYENPNLSEDSSYRKEEPIEGNINRFISAFATTKLSEESRFSNTERAVYGSLCGNLQAMLLGCRTWEDYLWAHLKASVEYYKNNQLSALLPENSPNKKYAQILLNSQYRNARETHDIINDLMNSRNPDVRTEAVEPFHIIQSLIMTDQFDKLVNHLAKCIENKEIYLFRFAAHFVLFLMELNLQVPETKDAILVGYIHYLVSSKQYNLIAFYASKLSEGLQEPVYAKILEQIEDQKLREECIEKAKEHGLNYRHITKLVVENIRKMGQKPVDIHSFTHENYLQDTRLTAEDKKKINSIKWLCFEESQRSEAMLQANALLRHFIFAGKFIAAYKIVELLPESTILWMLSDEPEDNFLIRNAKREFQSWKLYLDALTAHSAWQTNLTKRPKEPVLRESKFASDQIQYSKDKRLYEQQLQKWIEDDQNLFENAKALWNEMLHFNYGWLHDLDPESEEEVSEIDEQRLEELKLLRKKCVPQSVFTLYNMLYQTGRYEECTSLALLVADDFYKIHSSFSKEELQQFLILMKDAEVMLL